MPKEISYYECIICHKKYNTYVEANGCETKHAISASVGELVHKILKLKEEDKICEIKVTDTNIPILFDKEESVYEENSMLKIKKQKDKKFLIIQFCYKDI